MKEELRKKYLFIRKNVKDKEKKSDIIMNKIINLDEYNNSKIIALYNNLKDEVSTKKLIIYSLKIGKTIVLPRVYKNTLKFYKIKLNEKYELSNFKIYEPYHSEYNYIKKELIDLVIVPGICFDIKGHRIGYGKGFYDNFLEDNMNTIGICFKEQIREIVPYEKHDKIMKKIITD